MLLSSLGNDCVVVEFCCPERIQSDIERDRRYGALRSVGEKNSSFFQEVRKTHWDGSAKD